MPPHRDKTGKEYLYLTTVGRVSGKPREIEIWFVEGAGHYFMLSSGGEASQWVKNIRRNGSVQVWLGGREFAAQARVLDQTKDAARFQLAQRLSKKKYD